MLVADTITYGRIKIFTSDLARVSTSYLCQYALLEILQDTRQPFWTLFTLLCFQGKLIENCI